ncbi:hypothetical protein ABEF95_003395 [Exophiala dermatitidis]
MPFAVYLATIVLWAYGFYTYQDQLRSEKEAQSSSNRDKSTYSSLDVPQSSTTIEDEIDSKATERNFEETEAIAAALATIAQNETRNFSTKSRLKPCPPHTRVFMNLDRPCDDELIQNFIRSGSLIRTHLENVGELCSRNGPVLVLKEGARLLRLKCANTWPIAERYATQLTAAAARLTSYQGTIVQRNLQQDDYKCQE